MLPSGPAAMPNGNDDRVGIGNSVIAPAVVIRPILLPLSSVNQRLPSAPAGAPRTWPVAVGMGKVLTLPDVVIRPTSAPPLAPPAPVNHRASSGPAAISVRAAASVENSRTSGGVGKLLVTFTC